MPKILRVSDIASTEILFFDPEFVEECYQFCWRRDIEFLPSLDDSNTIYVRDDSIQNFRAERVDRRRRIDGSLKLFQPKVLEAFRRNHLLFVCSDGELSGVIHFSDFNKSVVSLYLYDLLFQYERSLRLFLQQKGLTNTSMKELFEKKVAEAKNEKSKDHYQKRLDQYPVDQSKIDKLPPFQSFYLDDLTLLANSIGIKLKSNVVQLRNKIMHMHELVNKPDWNTDDYIFDFDAFETFFQYALALHADYRKIKNKVAFLQGYDKIVSFE